MKWLQIDYIKQHSRIDFDCEDSILELYANAAEDTVLNYLNRSYQDLIESYGKVPPAIKHASLMLVDVSYQHRSPISPTNVSLVPYTFDILVKPYMRLAGGIDDGEVQTVTLGSDVKIVFTAELPDDLTLKDVAFSVTAYNTDATDKKVQEDKSACIEMNKDVYVMLFNSEELGVGAVMLKIVCDIPDEDFPDGFRKEVVRFNPKVEIKG